MRHWMPACTAPLVRHRRRGEEASSTTTSLVAPDGCYPECYLGIVHLRALEGTARIVVDGERGYCAIPKGGAPNSDEMDDGLGCMGMVHPPLSSPCCSVRHRASGASVLICGQDDPLRGEVETPPIDVLGYLESIPGQILPRMPTAGVEKRNGCASSPKRCDYDARRHRVSLRRPTQGRGWELGALLDRDPGGGIPVWIDGTGRLSTDTYAPTRHPYQPAATVRSIGAPATWHEFGSYAARGRAVVRRSIDSFRRLR